MEQIVTVGKKFNCVECNNEVVVKEGMKVGDFFECEFCGLQYEIITVSEAGEYGMKVVEEEK